MKTIIRTSVIKSPNVKQADEEYKKLATKLGVQVAPIPSELLLRNVLSTLSIAVYDYAAVRRYLISKKPEGHYFIWQKARNQKEPVWRSNIHPYWQEGWTGSRRVHGSVRTEGLYDKPIPFPVLLTMDQIEKKAKAMGFSANFYISDFAKPQTKPPRSMRLDPFLAVGTSDSNTLFVIERWDEPGFREEVYSTKAKAKTATTKRSK